MVGSARPGVRRYRPRAVARLRGFLLASAWTGAIALVLWLVFPHGFANYDATYALVWGRDLAHGRLPDYDVTLAPTPHPLATLGGLVLSPLGDGGETALVVIAYLALGAVGYLVYRLGAETFHPAVGLLAAVIVLTREPVLSYGVRAYVDLPYLALVLGALLVETRRPRAGAPVLVLLGIAGLLRPEAWLFAGAYWLYLGPRIPRREWLWLLGLVLAPPAIWLLADLIVSGDALHSLTGTRENVETLGRKTGLQNVPVTMPRRLGEILREPVLVGAVVGGALALTRLRERSRVLIWAGVVSVAAFAVLAASGLPIITRYLLLTGTILAVFAALGVFGWLLLPRRDPGRPAWTVAAAAVGVLLVAFGPAQADRLRKTQNTLATQDRIRADLERLVDDGAFRRGCAPVTVPNHRPVPLLALWLDRDPKDIRSAQLVRARRGIYVDPASRAVERAFILDPRDPRRLSAAVPPGFRFTTGNRSWRLFERC